MRRQNQRLWPGVNTRVEQTPRGPLIRTEPAQGWQHPWFTTAEYVVTGQDKKTGQDIGEWRATVKPGFINGRDTYIGDKPLTDDPAPYLVLNAWRDPLRNYVPAANLDGEIRYTAAEGYPDYFAELGVRPASKGGTDPAAEFDPNRTRELRAMDIVLSQPRFGSRLEVGVTPLVLVGQTQKLDAVFDNARLLQTGGRASLFATAKFLPPGDPTIAAIYGTLLDGNAGQSDELQIATVFMVSPPGYTAEDAPDATWTPHIRHRVFWNLGYASRAVFPPASSPPITLLVPLLGGLAQPIINGLLTLINDTFEEALAFLRQVDARGKFWGV